jgi:hypothetical protein
MMKNSTVIRSALLAAMAAAPFHAHALSAKAGLDACADAMVSELADKQGAPMVYNLDPSSTKSPRPIGRSELYHLDARDPKSEEVIARYDCFINHDAQVQKLVRVPLDAPDARFRATGVDY